MSQCYCGKNLAKLRCTKCRATCYCSRACQKKDWRRHSKLCSAIHTLSVEKLEQTKYISHLTPREHKKLIGLVGKRCEVECCINDLKTLGLWDTGAMVSVLSSKWLKENLPGVQKRALSELVDEPLDIKTANQCSMSCSGWVELSFQMRNSTVLQVPFLVMEDRVEAPIIGFNVILELLKEGTVDILEEIKSAMKLDQNVFEETINLIQTAGSDSLAEVRSEKRNIHIDPGCRVEVCCRAPVGCLDEPISAIFEPDELQQWPEELRITDKLVHLWKGLVRRIRIHVVNTSGHQVTLYGGTVLGLRQFLQ